MSSVHVQESSYELALGFSLFIYLFFLYYDVDMYKDHAHVTPSLHV